MVEVVAGVIVAASGAFLIGLAGVIFIRPRLARRFLESFASSARAHVTEQVVRLIAGAAMVGFGPSTPMPHLFTVLGWVLMVTAVGLLLVPWRWHHRFGKWAIPFAIRHLNLVGLGALGLGTLVLAGVFGAL